MIKHYGSEGPDVPKVMASTRDGLRAKCVSECRSHPLRHRDMCTAGLVEVVR